MVIVEELLGTHPLFSRKINSAIYTERKLHYLYVTEPTGAWFSATPPVGQGMGLFQTENQEKRGTPTNQFGVVFCVFKQN